MSGLNINTESGWRGDASNDIVDDRGWILIYQIPFSSLGLAGTPTQGTSWRMALVLHDRDSDQAAALPDKFWPVDFNTYQLESWSGIEFGM